MRSNKHPVTWISSPSLHPSLFSFHVCWQTCHSSLFPPWRCSPKQSPGPQAAKTPPLDDRWTGESLSVAATIINNSRGIIDGRARDFCWVSARYTLIRPIDRQLSLKASTGSGPLLSILSSTSTTTSTFSSSPSYIMKRVYRFATPRRVHTRRVTETAETSCPDKSEAPMKSSRSRFVSFVVHVNSRYKNFDKSRIELIVNPVGLIVMIIWIFRIVVANLSLVNELCIFPN